MTPDELADARERCGAWRSESDLPVLDSFDEAVKRRERLEALFPGFTLEQIEAGLRTPACEEAKP
jgi:hypothetical protein